VKWVDKKVVRWALLRVKRKGNKKAEWKDE
jgi:hypothetical protein